MRLLMKQRMRSQRSDGFEESEMHRTVAGCHVWAYMMDAKS